MGDVRNEDLIQLAGEYPEWVRRSPEETRAFRDWHDREIDSLREQFPKREAMMLGWKTPDTI